jgi:hypothetical protein
MTMTVSYAEHGPNTNHGLRISVECFFDPLNKFWKLLAISRLPLVEDIEAAKGANVQFSRSKNSVLQMHTSVLLFADAWAHPLQNAM